MSYVNEFTASEVAARKYSTLDLCDVGAFTFILNSANADVWRGRIRTLQEQYQGLGLDLNAYFLTLDFDVASNVRGQAWIEGAGLKDGGGLLVRPDQHILLPLTAETAVEDISSALRAHLGH